MIKLKKWRKGFRLFFPYTKEFYGPLFDSEYEGKKFLDWCSKQGIQTIDFININTWLFPYTWENIVDSYLSNPIDDSNLSMLFHLNHCQNFLIFISEMVTIKDLQQIAKNHNLSGYSKLNKPDLISFLRKNLHLPKKSKSNKPVLKEGIVPLNKKIKRIKKIKKKVKFAKILTTTEPQTHLNVKKTPFVGKKSNAKTSTKKSANKKVSIELPPFEINVKNLKEPPSWDFDKRDPIPTDFKDYQYIYTAGSSPLEVERYYVVPDINESKFDYYFPKYSKRYRESKRKLNVYSKNIIDQNDKKRLKETICSGNIVSMESMDNYPPQIRFQGKIVKQYTKNEICN